MPIFYANIVVKILSSFFFLLSGIFWKKILIENRVNYHLIFYRTLSSIGFIILFILIFKVGGFENDIWVKPISDTYFLDWLICICICLFSFWGLYFFTSAIKIGRFSFVGSLSTTTSFFSFIVAVLIYNEITGWEKWIAIVMIVLGYLYHQSNNFSGLKFSKEVLFLLLSSLFWGVSFVLFLIPIKVFGVLYFSLILECCVLASTIGLLVFKEKRVVPYPIDTQTFLICVLIGLMICGGSILSNLALTQLPVSINILISLLFETVTILYGIMKLKEKLLVKDWVLIVCVTVGVFITLV